MARTSDKRERLIQAANTLIHRKGFHRTTLADIAKQADVPLGNVYYYFKTKEDICATVIDERKKALSNTLDICCKKTDPRTALKKLVKDTMNEAEQIAECGCAYAGLCQELDNESEPTLAEAADNCIVTVTEWSVDKFRDLGYRNAKELGFEFMARLEGALLLGHAMHDAKLVRAQLNALCKWLDALPASPREALAS